jgi:hypothetical protein
MQGGRISPRPTHLLKNMINISEIEFKLKNRKGTKCLYKNIICQEQSGCGNCQIYLDVIKKIIERN